LRIEARAHGGHENGDRRYSPHVGAFHDRPLTQRLSAAPVRRWP
jgi:hypothetical protein